MADALPAPKPLDKARAALIAAKDLCDRTPLDERGVFPLAADLEYARLLRAAEVNAAIALVEAVDRLTRVIATHAV